MCFLKLKTNLDGQSDTAYRRQADWIGALSDGDGGEARGAHSLLVDAFTVAATSRKLRTVGIDFRGSAMIAEPEMYDRLRLKA